MGFGSTVGGGQPQNSGGGFSGGGGGYQGGGGMVCPSCGSTNCRASLRKSGDNLYMTKRPNAKSGLLGFALNGLNMRRNHYASYGVCNNCGHSWKIGRTGRGGGGGGASDHSGGVVAIEIVLRIVIFMALAAVNYAFLPHWSETYVICMVISLVAFVSIITGFISKAILRVIGIW